MTNALYGPSFGYYAQRENRIGEEGDFVTSPRISPVFGFALSRLVLEFLARHGDEVCSIVDIGCGDANLLVQLLDHVGAAVADRARFVGVDRDLGRARSSVSDPRILLVEDLAQLSSNHPSLIFSNELFDALPFARLVQRSEGLRELWVRGPEGSLEWFEADAPSEYERYFSERGIQLREGQFADVCLDWSSLYGDLCGVADRALLVTIDYGFPQERLFDHRIRMFGTAAAFRNHQVHRDLLATPGEQDLTAHINFSDLQRTGESKGLSTLLFTRQAEFLLSLGATGHPLFRPVQDVEFNTLSEATVELEKREAAKRLILPDGIGQEMRVLIQARNLVNDGWSFQRKLF